MYIEKFKWPEGKTCAAMLSVNLDAEYFGRIYYPDADVDQGPFKLMGSLGIKYGLPRLLDVFDAYGVKATFFIPGAVARRYPEDVKSIAARGHEIGCHGNEHENLALLAAAQQREALMEAKRILTEISGATPVGFRMPEGEITEETLCIVKSLGFAYSSSLNDDDVPYVRQPAGLLELPLNWGLYDLPYFVFNFDPPVPYGQSRVACIDKVLENWKIELEAAHRWGTLYTLQLDPQATGEQGKLFMLEELLDEVKAKGDIWIATGREIAEYCAESAFHTA